MMTITQALGGDDPQSKRSVGDMLRDYFSNLVHGVPVEIEGREPIGDAGIFEYIDGPAGAAKMASLGLTAVPRRAKSIFKLVPELADQIIGRNIHELATDAASLRTANPSYIDSVRNLARANRRSADLLTMSGYADDASDLRAVANMQDSDTGTALLNWLDYAENAVGNPPTSDVRKVKELDADVINALLSLVGGR